MNRGDQFHSQKCVYLALELNFKEFLGIILSFFGRKQQYKALTSYWFFQIVKHTKQNSCPQFLWPGLAMNLKTQKGTLKYLFHLA